MRNRREKTALVIVILLVGVVFCVGVENIAERDTSRNQQETNSFMGNVRFAPSNTTTRDNELIIPNSGVSMGHSSSLSVAPTRNYYAEKKQNMFPSVQGGGAKTLYTTSSASVRSYGGGGGLLAVGSMRSQNASKGTAKADNSSFVGNIHTFVAMSSPVRSSAEEFEYGENAIGADNPHAVIRRTPGSGPVTDDPGHTPTVVGTTPIGEGVCFMIVLAIGYVIRHQYKVRKQEIK